MGEIRKEDGIYYYGDKRFRTADELYRYYRERYHESLGKVASKRLNRLGSRRERVHDCGFIFSGGIHNDCYKGLVPVRLLGLVCGSYCRMLGGWDIPGGTDDEIECWIDWAFSKGSGALRTVGLKQKVGRTSKRLNTRYR